MLEINERAINIRIVTQYVYALVTLVVKNYLPAVLQSYLLARAFTILVLKQKTKREKRQCKKLVYTRKKNSFTRDTNKYRTYSDLERPVRERRLAALTDVNANANVAMVVFMLCVVYLYFFVGPSFCGFRFASFGEFCFLLKLSSSF